MPEEILRPKTPPVKPERPLTPPTRAPLPEEGLAEPGWDPVESLSWGAAGAMGGAPLGPIGMATGFAGGFGGDVAYQMASNISKGLPWYLSIPAELVAGIAGAKGATRGVEALRGLGRRRLPLGDAAGISSGPVSRPAPAPRGISEPLVEPPSTHFQPQQQYSGVHPDAAKIGSTVEGRWPNIRSTLTGDVGFEAQPGWPLSRNAGVRGQWPNLQQAQTGTIWPRALSEPVTEVVAKAVKAPKASKGSIQPPPEVPPNSVWRDVKDFTRSAHDLAGTWFHPVLTAIERAAGPEVGRQITAMEGAVSAAQGRIWQAHFGELTDVLKKLPHKLGENFIDTLEGKAVAATPQVEHATNVFHKVLGTQGSALLAQQEKGIQIVPLENYFPREFEPAFWRGLIASPERQTAIVRKMVKDGVAISHDEARSMLKDIMSRPARSLSRSRPTGAEFDRVKVLPPEFQAALIRDPLRAITLRGKAISRRLAELEVYGDKQIKLRRLIQNVDDLNKEKVRKLVKLTMGRDPVEEGLHQAASKLMGFQAVTSLSLSGLMNMSQPSLLALRTSLPNMAKAIFATAAHPMQSWAMARQLGIYADMAQRQLQMEITGGAMGRVATGSLRFFNLTERFVRAVAAEGGADWAKTIQKKLVTASPKEAPWLRRELTRLNFTAPEIERLLTTRAMTPNDVDLIKWSIADQVSFLPRPGRKSEFYLTSPMGPVILQFKNFLMNTSRLLKQIIWDEWRAGNKAPFFRAVGIVFPTLAIANEPLADINAVVRGSHRPVVDFNSPSSIAWRAVDNVMQIGALGLGLGLLQEMTGLKPVGWSDLPGTILGPTAGMLSRDVQNPVRAGVRRIPYIGPILSNTFTPSGSQSKSELRDDLWDRLGYTQRVVTRKRLQDLNNRLRRLKE